MRCGGARTSEIRSDQIGSGQAPSLAGRPQTTCSAHQCSCVRATVTVTVTATATATTTTSTVHSLDSTRLTITFRTRGMGYGRRGTSFCSRRTCRVESRACLSMSMCDSHRLASRRVASHRMQLEEWTRFEREPRSAWREPTASDPCVLTAQCAGGLRTERMRAKLAAYFAQVQTV